MMNKADLRTGMVVELRNGKRFMVIVGDFTTGCYGKQSIMLVNSDGFTIGARYDDNLVYNEYSDGWDIIAVYQPKVCGVDAMLSNLNAPLWTRQPEVDWSKVAVDTKVFIRDSDNTLWKPRYFCKFKDGKVWAFTNGGTSFTSKESLSWNQAKLA